MRIWEVHMSTTHKRFSLLIIAAVVLIASFTLLNCGGGGGGSSNSGSGNADYVLTVEPAGVSAFQGSSLMIKASVSRNAGTSAEVAITLANAPAGVQADVVTLPGNVTSGYLRLSLAPDTAAGGPIELSITGTSGTSSATAHLALTVKPAEPGSQEKIQAALAAGTIDYGTSLLYRAYALYGDARLPAGYLGSGSNEEDNELRSEIISAGTSSIGLSLELQAALEPFTVRPADPKSWYNQVPTAPKPRLSRSAKGSTLYASVRGASGAASGWNWISERRTAPVRVWAQTNGDPEYDSITAAAVSDTLDIIDKIWGPMTALMGEPVYDQEGGDNAIDIYIVDWLSSVNRRTEDFTAQGSSSTFKDYPLVGKASSAFILIPRAVLHNVRYHASIIHEFFHVLQMAHNGKITGSGDGYWFIEASARWASVYYDRTLAPWKRGRAAYNEAYTSFTSRFQKSTEALNASTVPHMYDAFIWACFLEQETGGHAIIGSIWTNLETASTFEQADNVINFLYPFQDNFRTFAVRNVNTEFLPGDPLPRSDRYISLDSEFRNDKVEPPYGGGPLTGDSELPYSAMLEPLSADYLKFTVSDAQVKQVVFDLSGLTVSPALDVDALIKTKGKDWERRNLNGQAELKFCFDKPGEALEDIRLVLSNHQYKQGESVPAGFMTKSFKAPCGGTISGTSSSTIDDAFPTYTISAQVTWVYDPVLSLDNIMAYYPEGTITFQAFDNSCLSISPSTYQISPTDGYLQVDMSTTPPTYLGSAATVWSATYAVTCDPPGSVAAPAGGSWFAGQGSTTPDGSGITGTFSNGLQTYTYNFTLQ